MAWVFAMSIRHADVLLPPQVDRSGSVAAFLNTVEGLVAPIDAFFDKVFVMTDDADVRANRQALLR